MISEVIAALSLLPMIAYVHTKKGWLGFTAWLIFAIACLTKIPDYIESSDYYNTAVFLLAFIFFTIMSISILKKNSEVFVEVTAFSALACAVYFPFAFINSLNTWIIYNTASLTVMLGNSLGFSMQSYGDEIFLNAKSVKIILACTAIESIALFTGATIGIKADGIRKVKAFLISVPTIYILNLFRNVFVIVAFGYSWFGENSFYLAHHVIAKILSTLALILIAYAVFRILPELAELIYSLKDEMFGGAR
ncbi:MULTISPECIES: archaeosortase A [unclassified Archaeoglobus]|jgi:archaeosortase A (PGF-CTERM-specific)|uniref:archaeosortase A n=1 Tax=unclassified Archaeoglobus TaxID=2643606 RepID=UPI0025B98705|nr:MULTISPECIES: archaeosortase A [unclassified Archaeoglobus]